jgi:hypothetical protein
LKSKYAYGETPGKPFGLGKSPQNLGNGLSTEFHRTIGHEEMDRLIGIPDVKVRMERQERIGVVTNGLRDETRLARTALCRPLHPVPNAATDGAFVIELKDRFRLFRSAGIHSKDCFFGFHRLGYFFKHRFKHAAMGAAVRHKLNREIGPSASKTSEENVLPVTVPMLSIEPLLRELFGELLTSHSSSTFLVKWV